MNALHMMRMPVNSMALRAFAVAEGTGDDDGYALHLALRRRFGAAAPQPFRLLRVQGEDKIFGYLPDLAAFNAAEVLPPIDDRLGRLFPKPAETCPMPGDWRPGARYGFEVKVRPVTRYGGRTHAARLAEGARSARERDAFLAAIERAAPGEPIDRIAVYRDWLVRRLTGAATLEHADLRQLRRMRFCRSNHGNGRRAYVEGHEVLFAGTLVVTDGAAFARILARGVGRHTAFGFGMLLLKPAGPA